MKSTRIFGLTAFVAICAMASAQGPVTLKLTPKVGDTFRYKLSAEMEVMGAKATVSGTVSDKVTEVTPEGGYTVESSSTEMVGNFSGTEMQIPDSKSTSKYKADGALVDIQGEEVAGANGAEGWRRANLSNFVYPADPLKIGDTWTSSIASDSKTGAVAAKTTYAVEKFEKVGNHETVKVKFTSKETEGSDPASSDGFVWLDVKDGTQIKVQVTWSNVPMMGNPIAGKVTMERID
jgi:hypothetical protein